MFLSTRGNFVFWSTGSATGLKVQFLDAFRELRKATVSFVICVCLSLSLCLSAWNHTSPTGRIIMKLGIWAFFENLSRKFKFHFNPTRITGALHEEVFTFMTISRQILLRIRNVSYKSCRENQIHILWSITVFRKSYSLWDNVEKCAGARGRRWQYGGALLGGFLRLHARKQAPAPAPVHSHLHTHTRTHTEICSTTFPRQQWFRERALVFRYTYLVCFVIFVAQFTDSLISSPV